ncbi:MAG: carbon storage regulator CsrA [Lutisporaceae bacterium]|jgi:carbon storage regulator
MLVLTRKKDEAVVIGDDIEIIVSEVYEDKVRIAIKAPKNIKIFRKELIEAVENENLKSADMSELDINGLREVIKE